jgi:hypothetical protein
MEARGSRTFLTIPKRLNRRPERCPRLCPQITSDHEMSVEWKLPFAWPLAQQFPHHFGRLVLAGCAAQRLGVERGGEALNQMDWITGFLAYQWDGATHGGTSHQLPFYFKYIPPPYFFLAVRSFGEYGAERDEIRPNGRTGSQELFAKKPANTGDFRHSDFGPRDLPKG